MRDKLLELCDKWLGPSPWSPEPEDEPFHDAAKQLKIIILEEQTASAEIQKEPVKDLLQKMTQEDDEKN